MSGYGPAENVSPLEQSPQLRPLYSERDPNKLIAHEWPPIQIIKGEVVSENEHWAQQTFQKLVAERDALGEVPGSTYSGEHQLVRRSDETHRLVIFVADENAVEAPMRVVVGAEDENLLTTAHHRLYEAATYKEPEGSPSIIMGAMTTHELPDGELVQVARLHAWPDMRVALQKEMTTALKNKGILPISDYWGEPL